MRNIFSCLQHWTLQFGVLNLHLVMEESSIQPFKVVGEVTVWQGHPADYVKARKDDFKKLKEQGG